MSVNRFEAKRESGADYGIWDNQLHDFVSRGLDEQEAEETAAKWNVFDIAPGECPVEK